MPLLETIGSGAARAFGLTSSGVDFVRSGLILNYDAGNNNSLTQNVFPNPLDPFAWFGTSGTNNLSISRDAAAGPSGAGAGSIPMRLQPTSTASDPHTQSYNSTIWNMAPASANQKWTISFWAKTNRVGSDITPLVCFPDSSGSVFTFANQITSFSIFPTTTWARYSATVTAPNDSRVVGIQIRLDASEGLSFTTDIQHIDGIQIEAGQNLTNLNTNSRDIWYDISGVGSNKNLTLTSGIPKHYTGGRYLAFNGSSHEGRSDNMSGLITGLSDASVSVWYKPNAQDDNGMVYDFCNTVNTSGNRDNFSMRQNWGGSQTAAYTTNSSGSFASVNFELAQYTNWRNYSAVRRGNVFYSYINGVLTNQVAISGTIRDTNRLIIGQDNIGTNFLNANFGIFQVYNRGLTDAEVLQNYLAFKSRYIP
jgi:hypothetical protein